MSVTNVQIAAVPTYTTAEMLKMVSKAIMDILATGQSHSFPGKGNLNRADLHALLEAKAELEQAVAAETEGGGIAIVQYGERV